MAKQGLLFHKTLRLVTLVLIQASIHKNYLNLRHLTMLSGLLRNLKISITDIKAAKNDINSYGTFTVLVRLASDTDNAPQIVEQFTNCNLNPASQNYIAKKIGNKYVQWDTSQRRLREYGEFSNQSKYIYVTMNSLVADGNADPSLLPFGFFGPPKPKDFMVFSGSTATNAIGSSVSAEREPVEHT